MHLDVATSGAMVVGHACKAAAMEEASEPSQVATLEGCILHDSGSLYASTGKECRLHFVLNHGHEHVVSFTGWMHGDEVWGVYGQHKRVFRMCRQDNEADIVT